MRAYWAVVSARFRALLQYRAAAAAGFGTQLFWGLIRVMIFDAFYRSTTAAQPMQYGDVVTYVWLGQAFLAVLPWNIDRELGTMIRSGNVAYELLRPIDLYWLWYSRSAALRTAPAVLRAVPMLVLAGLFFGMRAPPSVASAAAWLVAMTGAVLLASAITTALTISLLWTISGEGISRVTVAGVMLFSGMIVPLPLFPDWAQGVLGFLPFRGLVDTPFRLYVGHIPAWQVVYVFGHQLAWTVALVALGRWLLSRGTRRLVVQGG